MDRLDDLEPVLDADGPEGMQPHGRISELRAFLKERLPQFMVPASIVVLSDLPVSPNGKIDRSKLPALDNNRPLDQAYVPPVSPIEVALSDIWAEILKIDQVGIDDNFFELGGDSLLGLDLVTKVSEKLNIRDLSIVAIFEAPTVREMAHFIDALLDAATAHSPVSLVM
jgi:acyl carrier protein